MIWASCCLLGVGRTKKTRVKMLRSRAFVWILALLTTAVMPSWSQADGVSQTAQGTADGLTVPEFDVGTQTADSAPQQYGPSIDPLPESRSLFLAGLNLNESVVASTGDSLGNSSNVSPVARVLGTLNFLKIGRRFETAIDYRGGGFFYEGGSEYFHQTQQMQATGRIFWQKAALTLSDSVADYPGGSFGSTWFGGAGAYNLGSTSVSASIPLDPGIAEFIGGSTFGLGQSALNNVALVELTDAVTTRSSVSVAGAYGISEYFGDNPGLIDGRQISGVANYGYQLNPRSEIFVVYGYRRLQFPEKTAGNIATQVGQFAYSRVFSRRLQMQLGVGPEYSQISTPLNLLGVIRFNLATHQINVSAYGALAYRLRKETVSLSYDRLVTGGSGLFAGANSNFAQFTMGRRLLRSWEASLDAGYVSLSRIQQSLSLVTGNSYQYGFAGVALARRLWRFNAFASYQFNDESFNTSICTATRSCSLIQRHVGTVGIYWHTHPIHLDHGSGQPAETGPVDNANTNDSEVPQPNN
jgi:hypothetical protein